MSTSPAPVVLYGIPNCDSVKKARARLDAAGVAWHFHDFKKAGLDPADLDRWLAQVGRDRLVNRQGTTWRRLDAAAQAQAATDAGARALLLAQPSLVKRPVMAWADGQLTVGLGEAFDAALAAAVR